MDQITKVKIRMYKTGTGDCFALKFYQGDQVNFNMMIDGGTWSGTQKYLSKYVKDLKDFLGNKIDVLVVTHEHKDHVHLFDVCKNMFVNDSFEVGQIWMGWTENDKSKKVKEWKKDFGKKKLALANASKHIGELVKTDEFASQYKDNLYGDEMLAMRKKYSGVLDEFAELHFSLKDGQYLGGLAGMEVVKKDIKTNRYEYLKQGDIKTFAEKLPGVKFYVLGPPKDIGAVKKEKGKKGSGEAYDHNEDLAKSDAFSMAMNTINDTSAIIDDKPFKSIYEEHGDHPLFLTYKNPGMEWRKIDHDWLLSSGLLALRIERGLNNLSLALAIEIGETGKVLLFPGDAEIGSWASWHTIDWPIEREEDQKHFTEELLNRTIFYKVAHHLSHNGTAKSLGADMMNHPDLMVMATLDYNIISSSWEGTMPNTGLLKDLVRKSKGRFIVMNDKDLFYDSAKQVPLGKRILEEQNRMSSEERKAFSENYVNSKLYHELTVML